MEKDPSPKREQKRDSARKTRDMAIYNQKSVRLKEALGSRVSVVKKSK